MEEREGRILDRLEEKTDKILLAVHQNHVEALSDHGDLKERVTTLESESSFIKWLSGLAVAVSGAVASFIAYFKG